MDELQKVFKLHVLRPCKDIKVFFSEVRNDCVVLMVSYNPCDTSVSKLSKVKC